MFLMGMVSKGTTIGIQGCCRPVKGSNPNIPLVGFVTSPRTGGAGAGGCPYGSVYRYARGREMRE